MTGDPAPDMSRGQAQPSTRSTWVPPAHRAERVALSCLAVSDVILVAGSFLPWVISGTAGRDSYATVRAARNIGVVGSSFWEAVLSVWFVVPLAVAVVLTSAMSGRLRLAAAVGVPLGFAALVLAVLVRAAPVESGIGPGVTALGSLGLLSSNVWLLRTRRRDLSGR